MPELPEAEYMVRRLREYAGGAAIARVRVLRASLVHSPVPRAFARLARGPVSAYSRRAKNVLIHLAAGHTIRIQLGMTGHVYWVEPGLTPPRFTRLLFELEAGGAIVFEDSRTLGSVTLVRTTQLEEAFAGYGPEPLDPAWRWSDLAASGSRLRQPVKSFLLDQTRIAGLGNIWAVESLFRARLDPARPTLSLTEAEWRTLYQAIRQTLRKAIENTFLVTAGPADFPEADLVRLNVYGREGEPCRRCRRPVKRTVLAGRSTYFCPGCQR